MTPSECSVMNTRFVNTSSAHHLSHHSYIASRLDLRLNHNAAPLCLDNGTIVVFGGRDLNGAKGSLVEAGIQRSTATLSSTSQQQHQQMSAWSPPRLVLSGDPLATGCVERRRKQNQWLGHCEFDGKLSVVRSARDGRIFMYGRANTSPRMINFNHGGRHLQVRWMHGATFRRSRQHMNT